MSLLLALPAELRLQIYAELLVCPDGYVEFSVVYPPKYTAAAASTGNNYPDAASATAAAATAVVAPGPREPDLALRWPRRGFRFCPALLRVSRAVHREALPLLYARNRFRFPATRRPAGFKVVGPARRRLEPYGAVPPVGPLFQRIGPANVARLRHVCVRFPAFLRLEEEDGKEGNAEESTEDEPQYVLRAESVAFLRRLRDACTGLRTVEFAAGSPYGVLRRRAAQWARRFQAVDDVLGPGGSGGSGGSADHCSTALELEVVVVIDAHRLTAGAAAAFDAEVMRQLPRPTRARWRLELRLAPASYSVPERQLVRSLDQDPDAAVAANHGDEGGDMQGVVDMG